MSYWGCVQLKFGIPTISDSSNKCSTTRMNDVQTWEAVTVSVWKLRILLLATLIIISWYCKAKLRTAMSMSSYYDEICRQIIMWKYVHSSTKSHFMLWPQNWSGSSLYIRWSWYHKIYRKTSNIRHTLLGNKIVDHSDVVGASPAGAAPTTSSFST